MEGIFLSVLAVSLAASAVLLPLVALRRRLERRYAPATRRAIWLAVALVLLLAPWVPKPQAAVVVEAPDRVLELPRTEQAPAGTPGLNHNVSAGLPAGNPAMGQTPAAGNTVRLPQTSASGQTPAQPEQPGAARTVTVLELLAAVWLLGGALVLAGQGGRYLLLRRRLLKGARPVAGLEGYARELGVKRRVRFYAAAAVETPMTMGLLRPIVLLGEEGTARAALEHELYHVKRWDVGYKALLLMACAMHWFNPLVWLLARWADRDVEACCDAAVVEQKDEEYKKAYGALLIAAAAGERSAFTTCFGGKNRQMKERLRQLFRPGKQSRVLVWALLAAAVVLSTLVACRSGETAQPSPEPVPSPSLSPAPSAPVEVPPEGGNRAVQYSSAEYGFTLRLPETWAEKYTAEEENGLVTFYRGGDVLMSLVVTTRSDFDGLYGDTNLAGMFENGGPKITVLGENEQELIYLHLDSMAEGKDEEYQRMWQEACALGPADFTCQNMDHDGFMMPTLYYVDDERAIFFTGEQWGVFDRTSGVLAWQSEEPDFPGLGEAASREQVLELGVGNYLQSNVLVLPEGKLACLQVPLNVIVPVEGQENTMDYLQLVIMDEFGSVGSSRFLTPERIPAPQTYVDSSWGLWFYLPERWTGEYVVSRSVNSWSFYWKGLFHNVAEGGYLFTLYAMDEAQFYDTTQVRYSSENNPTVLAEAGGIVYFIQYPTDVPRAWRSYETMMAMREDVKRFTADNLEVGDVVLGLRRTSGTMWPLPFIQYGSLNILRSFEAGVHEGVDIQADEHVTVQCAESGTVTAAGDDPEGGKYIEVTVGPGRVMRYGHLEYVESRGQVGSRVVRGDILSYALEENGVRWLHFGIQEDGRYVDPLGSESEPRFYRTADFQTVSRWDMTLPAASGRTLSAEEVAAISKALGLNGDWGDTDETHQQVCCFFTSYYESPEQLDLAAFLRYFPDDGTLEAGDEAEFEQLSALPGFPFEGRDGGKMTLEEMFVPTHRYRRADVDAALERFAGITTAELEKSGMLYLSGYDAFYNFTSDWGPGMFHADGGEQSGSLIRLWCELGGGGRNVLTLREKDGKYMICAFQYAE